MNLKQIKKGIIILLSGILLLITILSPTNKTIAKNNNINAELFFNVLNKQYQKLSIQQQFTKREKIIPLLKIVKTKTQKSDIKGLLTELTTKAEEQCNSLKKKLNFSKKQKDEETSAKNTEKNTIKTEKNNELQKIREEMLNYINKERRKAGLKIMQGNKELNTSAQSHSEYMSQSRDFAHITKKGLDPFKRIKNAGYKGLCIGENIAWNQRSVKEVMQSRMNSPGHRENILNPKYKEIGIGLKNYYWTQNFGGCTKLTIKN